MIKAYFTLADVNLIAENVLPDSVVSTAIMLSSRISVEGASWTLDSSKETVNCNIKHTKNKFSV